MLILFSVLFMTFFLGVFSAYLVSFYNFFGVNFFKYSLLLSFAIPPYIYGYTLSAFFENFGTAYSLISFISEDLANKVIPKIGPLIGSIISLSLTLFGYVFILARSSFLNQSRNLLEVGKSLGFRGFDTLFKIILPTARPAIFIGLSLVAMETLSDFGTVSYFGISTFTTGIYNSWFIFDDLKTANFLSLFLLIFILFFFSLESFSRKNLKFFNTPNSFSRKNKKTILNGSKGILAFSFCLLLFTISFLFPLFQMLYWAFSNSNLYDYKQLLQLNLNSIKLIILSSLIIICLSLFSNFGVRILRSKFLQFFSTLSISGYAIPGIVISISVISLFTYLDNFFNLNFQGIFIGTIYGLIFGYCIRFYSISFNTIKTVYLKINTSIDDSAYLLGFNKFNILRKIHYPLLQKNFVFAFILISIEIIKELPITLILRPFNFDTFSTSAFNLASNDLIEAAATPSLFIILWSSLLIFLSIKFFLIDKK
jgi:iron(III) transport system permease protein